VDEHVSIIAGQLIEAFLAHQFSRHVTIYNTYNTCWYGNNYLKHWKVAELFETLVMSRGLPSQDRLQDAGPLPS